VNPFGAETARISALHLQADATIIVLMPVNTPQPLFVTRPELPPLEEFLPYLQQIWDTRILSNNGPFHQQLETALCEHLGVPHISLFTNATMALVTALQSLRITGEVITTPYSFVATAHSLMWNGIKPVFADIDPVTLNLDPRRIEAAITPQTTAIMPIHCYGTPCDVDAIRRIADDYNLKVIYDAAHAFGVCRSEAGQMRSVLNHGDLSVLSFHATKVFNTFEGGAIISPDARTKQRIDHLKNFGFTNETTVVATGINGKMSEFNAALGLVQLRRVDDAIRRRGEIESAYRQLLAGVPGLRMLDRPADATPNHSYFPVLIGPGFGASRDAVYEALKAQQILARRYFYPLISDFPMYRGLPSANPANLPVARATADQVLCLPIYPSLADADVERVAAAVIAVGGSSRPAAAGRLASPTGHAGAVAAVL
jgi:dTDP-4-amino-4,6-dideoxygalactose transaminase